MLYFVFSNTTLWCLQRLLQGLPHPVRQVGGTLAALSLYLVNLVKYSHC